MHKSKLPAILLSALLLFILIFGMSLGSTVAQDEEAEPTPIVDSLGTGDIHISFWNGFVSFQNPSDTEIG